MTVPFALAVARVRPSRGEGYRVHRVRVAGQGVAELVGPIPVREIPGEDGSVCIGAGQGAPIPGDGHTPDPRGGAGKWLAELVGPVPVRQIPQNDSSVCVSGRQGAPIRSERRPPDPASVSGGERGLNLPVEIGELP
jgi:hypothetical protein